MPAAAIGAVGSIAGGVISGKGAKKAAKIQQKTAMMEMAQTKAMYDDAVTRYQPDINYGNGAESLYNGLLGNGGDAAASQKALSNWKNSVSYNTVLDDALNGVNANAYSAGMGRSGAAMKALQNRASDVSNGYLQAYLGDLQNSVNTGAQAKSSLTGVSMNANAANNAATQTAGNAASNAALSTANTWSNVLQNLGNLGGNAYASSYGGGSGSPVYNGSNFNSWVSETPSWLTSAAGAAL